MWKAVTHAGRWTITPHRLQLFSNLFHADTNCPWTSLTNPVHCTYSPTLAAHPRRQTSNSSSRSSVQDRHARHETCTFSPYPSACRATAYSFETQTWERAWGRWGGRRVHGLWREVPQREDRTEGCETAFEGSEQKENKNRWWKTKMKEGWSRWGVKTCQKERTKRCLPDTGLAGAWLINTEGLAGAEEETRLKFGANPVVKKSSQRARSSSRVELSGSTAEVHRKQSSCSATATKTKEEAKKDTA